MKSWIRRSSVVLMLAFGGVTVSIPTPAIAKAGSKKQAAALSRRAIKLYKRGEYQRAAALFLEAFDLSHRPAQLRNAAKAYEEAGLLEDAKSLWERYIDQEGLSVDETNEAKAHLKIIQEREKNKEIRAAAEDLREAAERARKEAQAARLAAEAASKRPQGPTTATTIIEEEPSPPIGGYLLLGGGAGTLAAGAVVWLIASGQLMDVDDRLAQKDAMKLITGITPAELEDEISSINSKRIASGVLVTVGLAAAAGGVAWLLMSSNDTETDVNVVVAPSEGGGQFAVIGRF